MSHLSYCIAIITQLFQGKHNAKICQAAVLVVVVEFSMVVEVEAAGRARTLEKSTHSRLKSGEARAKKRTASRINHSEWQVALAAS